MGPFIEHLIENPRVRMLWNETPSQQFEPFPRDFLDYAGIVHEPPAPERHQVGEFSGDHTDFVLILTAQQRHEKTVVRVFQAEVFDAGEIGPAYAVTRQTQMGIQQFLDADH